MTVNGPEGDDLGWDTIVWLVYEDDVRWLRRWIFTATKARDLVICHCRVTGERHEPAVLNA